LALYRLLDAEKSSLATYEFAAIITTLVLGTVAEWGLNLYLTRQVARDKRAIDETFGTALALRLGLAALVIPASALIVLIYNQLWSANLIDNRFDTLGLLVILVLAATALPGAVSGAVTAVFLATERPIIPAVVGLMTNIASALLKLAALVLGFGVLGVAGAALVATCGSALVFSALFFSYFGRPQLHLSRTMAQAMLRAGFPLMLNALLLAVFFRFDVTIIQAFRTAEELTAYTAAYKYVALTQILPPIVINAIFPLFARQAVENRPAAVGGAAGRRGNHDFSALTYDAVWRWRVCRYRRCCVAAVDLVFAAQLHQRCNAVRSDCAGSSQNDYASVWFSRAVQSWL
jgi:O-antigen/teichoic acid export membrane protein